MNTVNDHHIILCELQAPCLHTENGHRELDANHIIAAHLDLSAHFDFLTARVDGEVDLRRDILHIHSIVEHPLCKLLLPHLLHRLGVGRLHLSRRCGCRLRHGRFLYQVFLRAT